MEGQGPQPPRLLMRLFLWFCQRDLRKYIEGDLIELYRERVEMLGGFKAKWRFFIDVLLLFRPGIIGFSKGNNSYNPFHMYKNHLKVGARNLWKDRFYTTINLFGLSIGLSFSFLVLLLVNYEFSFEDFYAQKDHIYRLGVHYNIGGQEDSYSNVPRPMGPAFKEEFPEVVDYTRVAGVNGLSTHTSNLKYDEQYFLSEKIFIADSSFFNVFDTQLIRGEKTTVLNRPNTIVLSENLAKTIFGEKDPIGQEIETAEDGRKFEVTGIFEDVPANTHLPYEAVISFYNYWDDAVNRFWYGRHVYTYVRLQSAEQAESLLAKYPVFYEKYMASEYEEVNGSADLILQSLEDIHLKSDLTWEANKNGDLTGVFILLAIGIFLVVIAEVNYLNLSLARSSLRKKEISVRKVIGATKSNISGQFVIETMLFTALAFCVSLVIVRLVYTEFLNLSGVDVAPFAAEHILIFAALTFGLGLLVSVYPSLILSGVRLVEGLKGRSKNSRASGRLQRMLVVFQFAISTIVILFTFVVKNQLDYVTNKDLGFDKENMVVFELEDSALFNKGELLRDQIKGLAGVTATSLAYNRPGVDLNHTILSVENNGEISSVGSQFMRVDHDFKSTVGLEVVEGRTFIKGSEADANGAVMINEAAKARFGWHDGAEGKRLFFNRDENGNPNYVTAIGVFKDFNIGSLHSGIEPIVLFFVPTEGDQLLVRFSSNSEEKVIAQVNQMMNDYNPRIPAKHQLLESELNRLYQDEDRLSKSMTYLSALTIVISVLGFVGLLSFSIAQREKEIGIRKVLGAKVSSVTMLFYKDLLLLIVIAQVIALPVNYYISQQWLNSFQYQSFPGLVDFALVLVAIIVLSLGTMAFQIVRIAFMNPAKVIKDD